MAEIMVVAGEASGDMHAAEVVRKIKSINPEVDFFGLGGMHLKKEGVEVIFDPTKLSTIGFLEGAKHFKKLYQVLNNLERELKNRRPEAAFLVDYTYFNRKVAKRAAKLDVPTVNYFAPSAWVWGKWRAKKIANYGVKVASVFPMEEEVYRKAGAEVEFVGHPLVDMVEPKFDRDQLETEKDLELKDRMVIGILPGSRGQEVKSLLPKMLKAAQLIVKEYPTVKFLLPLANTISRSEVEESVSNYNIDITLLSGGSQSVMEASDLILVASGTASLEAACLKTPMVIAYKTSWSSYILGKLLVRISHIGLPNIIAKEKVVPELLQSEVTGQNLAKEAVDILNNQQRYQKIKRKLNQVKNQLGEGGAAKRVAKLVLDTGGIKFEAG